MSKERRREKRQQFDAEVSISWRDAGGLRQFCSVRGLDVSDSGLRVESPEPVAAGSFVHVHAENRGFGGTAIVRYCERRGTTYVIGLEFSRHASQPAQEDDTDEFVDYYDLLQLSPTAEMDTIHRVYRILATRFHPDNAQTGDIQRFLLLRKAYETLKDPAKRASYDTEHRLRQTGPMPIFELRDFTIGIDAETNRRLGVLCLLYGRRRTDPDKPGMSLLDLEQIMTTPREHLVFTVWYLKETKLLRTEGNAEFEITAEGVRFVEESLPSNRLMQRLLRAPAEAAGATQTMGRAAAN